MMLTLCIAGLWLGSLALLVLYVWLRRKALDDVLNVEESQWEQ